MRKLFLILMLTVMGIFSWQMSAQTMGDYGFSTGTDATKWVTLSTTTSLITPGAGDYGVSTVHDIGFPFFFAGDYHTQFSVNADGNLRFGSVVTGTYNYSTPFNSSNANVNNPKINFFGCDGFLTDSGYVYHQVVGDAPNRVCVIEFATSTYTSSSRAALCHFQVQLFEGSNDIQVVFSTPPPILPNVTRQTGMCKNNTDILLVNNTHQATHYTAGSSDNIPTATWPDLNRYYLFTAPTCLSPGGLAVSNTTGNSADVSWLSSTETSSWDIYVTDNGTDILDSNTVPTTTVYDTFYNLTGLTANTQYYVYLRSICSDGNSNWASVSVHTLCDGLTQLPYTCGFDSVGTETYPLPDCWERGANSTTYPYSYSTSSAYEGSRALYFYTANYVAMPPIDPNYINLTETQLTFMARGSNYVLQVGVMDPNDPSSFELVQSFTLTSSYAPYEVNFSNYTGTNLCVAFRNTANNYIYVDNVTLEPIPDCPKPQNLSAATMLTTATLTWVSNETDFILYYKPSSSSTYTEVPYVSSPYDLTGLASNTSYDWYVAVICNGTDTVASFPSTFTTPCGAITQLPYFENFDNMTAGVAPTCWTRGNYHGSYPQVYSSSHVTSGSLSVYFYYMNTLAMPPIDPDSIDISNTQLTFWAKANAGNSMEVGFYVNPTDSSTFTPVTTITPTTGFTFYEIPLTSYTPSMGNYVGFRRFDNPSGGLLFFDDVTLEELPSCVRPMLNVVVPTSSEATLSWVSTGTNFTLYYKSSADADYTSVTNLSDTFYVLTNLTPATNYTWYVSVTCDDGTETSSFSQTFSTSCAELSTMPYFCDFETVPTGSYPLPLCWTKGSGSTTYPYSYSTSSAYQGGRALYFYTANTVALPPIDGNALNMSDLQVSFYAKGSNYELQVGVMTNPSDASTFTSITSLTLTSDYTYYEVPFTNYTGTGTYVALRNTASNYIYVDNITIEPIPACSHPVNLTASVTTDAATLSWSSTAPTFDLYYRVSGSADYQVIQGVSLDSDGEYLLTGLTASTDYDWYVQTACGSSYEPTSDVAHFTTSQIPVDLPYTAVFDATDGWQLNNGSCSNYWMKGAVSDTLNGLFITNNGTTSGYSISSISAVTAEKFLVIGDASTVQLAFDFRCGGEGSYDFLKVFLAPMSESYPAATTLPTWASTTYSTYAADFSDYLSQTGSSTLPYKLNLTNGNTIHVEVLMDNPVQNPDPTSLAKLVLVWRNDGSGGTQPGAIVTNLQVSALTCDRPSPLMVTNLTENSADVSWSAPGDAGSFIVQYAMEGTDWESSSVESQTVSDTTISLVNLLENTTYQIRVATDCGGDTSLWREYTFTTACVGMTTLPYSCDFETVPSGSYQIPNCWTKGPDHENYPYSYSSSSSYQGDRVLYFYTPNSIALPPVDPSVITLSNTMVSFYAKGNNYKLVVGVMDNPGDINTFVAVDTLTLTSDYLLYEVVLSNYTGNGRFVALRNIASNYIYVDNLTLSDIPSCLRPQSLSLDNLTSTSADIYIHDALNAGNYQVTLTTGGNSNTFTTTDTVVSLTGLSPATSYTVDVATICDDGTITNVVTLNFTTACGEMTTIPYFENFDSYPTAGNPLPDCWTKLYPYSNGSPYITSTNHYSGARSVYFFGQGSVALLPPINTTVIPMNTLKFSMRIKENSSGTRSFEIGIMSNPTDTSTFVSMGTLTSSIGDSWTDVLTVSFDNYTGTGNYVAIRLTSPNNAAYIDDVQLEFIDGSDTTITVTNPTVATTAASNTTQTSATLNGTITNPDNVTITAKGFQWKATAGGTYQSVNATGAGLSYNLTGLTSNTGYTYRAFITFNGTTVYGEEMTFTTLPEDTPEPCNVPTNLHTTDIQNEAISIAWNADANVSSWNIQYRPENGNLTTATTTTNAYTITGLTGLTTYEIQVQANCGDGNLSDWTAAITPQTTNVGIGNHLDNSIALFPNPAKEYVDVRIDGDVDVTAMEVYDVYGKLINTVKVTDNPTRINVSGLANGMYFVRVTTEQGVVTKMFVKK